VPSPRRCGGRCAPPRSLHHASATVRPQSRAETGAYTEHRATVTGATTAPFDVKVCDAICEIGRGNLRATNYLFLSVTNSCAARSWEGLFVTLDGLILGP
jgi:hypothetical protein